MPAFPPSSLHAGFAYHAEMTPDNPALIIGDRPYTYSELADTARRWAWRLIDGVRGRPRRVGVFAYRNEVSYAGVLACLFAGAAFVPLNRKFPLERTRAMLLLADVDALIVDNQSLGQLHDILKHLPRMPLLLLPETAMTALPPDLRGKAFDSRALAAAAPVVPLPEVTSRDLAYLLFTSGATGVPSGVPITHGNVRAFLDVNKARYQLTPQDRLTQTFEQTFDLSVFDLFMAWDNGAAVCTMQPFELLAPLEFLRKHEITVWFSVPSVASHLIRRGALAPGSMPTLRWSLFCGENLPRFVAEAWQRAAPRSIVENLYGPTELTIACSAYRWNPVHSPDHCVNGLLPIGEIYPGLDAVIMDDNLHEVPPGASGELCVAGPQTSSGYWHNSKRTAERFFERLASNGTRRWYHRTGDIVVLREGHLVYLGRKDTQVKIGGHRVELGEVEGALRLAGCNAAVAMAWPEDEPYDYIVAVVSGGPDTGYLQARLREALPNYMVPRAIHTVDQIPLNTNGKIDRHALRRWLSARMAQTRALAQSRIYPAASRPSVTVSGGT